MKQEKRTSNAARKKAAILKDISKLLAKNVHIDKVYKRLADKYFVATGTIYRYAIEREIEAVHNKEGP